MTKVLIHIIFLIFLTKNLYAQIHYNNLQTITEKDFLLAREEERIYKDEVIRKSGGVIKISNCSLFRDKNSDQNFLSFSYFGEFKNPYNLTVLKKSLYNGNEYIIIENSKRCNQYLLLGRPHVFSNIVINFNESETTDKKNIIEVWKIINKHLNKIKAVYIKKDFEFDSVRIKGNLIYLRDNSGNYWKFHINP